MQRRHPRRKNVRVLLNVNQSFRVMKKHWRSISLGVLLAVLTVASYWPALSAGFIWDDDAHLTTNPCIVGPLGLKEIWTTSAARICPLVLTNFWVQYRLWGLHPFPYHLVNILMHAATAVVLWRTLVELKVPGAWLGAALWAVHPVQVESVAWITELKNTQSAFFYVLTVWCFLKSKAAEKTGERIHSKTYYVFTLLCGALAMASKSSTVVLPAVLALCAWWVDRRWRVRDILRIAPLLLISAAAAALSHWTQKIEGTGGPEWQHSWPERVIIAGKVVWFYLGKLAWPHPLIFIYPKWQIDASTVWSYLPVLGIAIVLLLSWRNRQTWGSAVFFAFAYFLVALSPVLGLVNHYFLRYSFVGDHFQYLASMGLIALALAGLSRLPEPVAMLPVVLLSIFAVATWQRTKIYHDQITLWEDTLAKNPGAWMAQANLGVVLARQGKLAEAIQSYERLLQLKPEYAEAYNDLGNALVEQGKLPEAIQSYERALQLKPDKAMVYINLGKALVEQGNLPEAIQNYERALQLKPDYADAYNNLGVAQARQGRLPEAIQNYGRALQLKPGEAMFYINLGKALVDQGNLPEAIQNYERALQLKPDFAEAYYNLGNALVEQGKLPEAIQNYQRALQLKPDFAEAYYNLGVALVEQRNLPEAIQNYERALQLKPDYADAYNNLGVARARQGRLAEAIQNYERALQLKPNNADACYNMGVALVGQGNLLDAIQNYERAIQLKPNYVKALTNLAYLLATSEDAQLRNGARAVTLSEQADELTGSKNPVVLATLAAAYAEEGRYPEAVEAANRAIERAIAQGNSALVRTLELQVTLYKANKPLWKADE